MRTNKSNVPFFLLTIQDDTEKSYAIDTFWLESIHFKQKIDRMAFTSLFEVRDMANSLYGLALEYNLGDSVKHEFIEKIKFVNYLLENLGNGGHNIALQRLKDKFGGKKGMSSKSKREADRIIRESLKGGQPQLHQQLPQFQPFAPMAMPMPFPLGPFSTPHYPAAHQQQNFPPARGVNGPCFICQQHGHVARYCPNSQGNGRGGSNSRRGGNYGRGNSGRRFFGKKRN